MKTVFATILGSIILALSAKASPIVKDDILPRTSDTCADPSLTTVYVEGYTPSNTAHTVNPLWVFVATNIISGGDWQIEGDSFRAWETPQDFTFPLYEFFNSVTLDVIVQVSTTGSPPTPPSPASDWILSGIVGYVYATQICGSLPLLVAFQEGKSDHWYTTDVNQHNSFISHGYTDAGIAGYVLPLNSNP